MAKSIATKAREFVLPITEEDELRAFVKYVFEVDIPDIQICETHTTPWRAFADAYFAEDSVSVWKSSRGFGGKSFLLALLGLTEAVTLKADVNILGGSGTQSQNVHEHMTRFWDCERAPAGLLDGDPTKWETKLKWPKEGKRRRVHRNVIRALKASQTSVRGPHPQRLREDEIDEMPLPIFDSSMGQTMKGASNVEPQTVLSSTHQYAFGTMAEVLSRADDRGWPVYIWCISGDCGIMSIDKGTIPMRDIQKGDRVYAHESGSIIKTVVTDHWSNGMQNTIVLCIGGRELQCTQEHKILTSVGWREAGSLKPGDLVSTMWTKESGSQRFVQDMPLQQAMPKLWEIDSPRCSTVSILCEQAKKQSAREAKECKSNLSLRATQASAVKAVQGLPQQITGLQEHEAGSQSCVGTAAFQWRANEGRESSGGIIRQSWPSIHRADQGSVLDRGLCDWGLVCGSPWSVLAHEAGKCQERQGKSSISRRSTLDPVGRSAISVGCATIDSIWPGGRVEVFDLTVEHGSSFVVEGVIVHNCWKESWANGKGWLSWDEIERKRNEVTTVIWNTEYDLQEPNPENRAIDTDSVMRMFNRDLGVYDGYIGQNIIHQEPVDGAVYVTGADWAKKIDKTCIVTWRIDVTPYLLVAFELTHREPWPVMVGKFRERLRQYPGKAGHDGTGIGSVVDDFIREADDEESTEILETVPDEEIIAVLSELPYPATAIIMKGERRAIILNQYISAIERGRFIAPHIKSMEIEHRLASVNDVFGRGHLPDTIAAGALGNNEIGTASAAAGAISTPQDAEYYYTRDSGILVPIIGGRQCYRSARLINDKRIRTAYRLSSRR